MQPETRKLLYDMLHAALGIEAFVAGKTLDDYRGDLLLRSAVERQFEIIGEAMTRLIKADPATAARITDYRRISGFRNLLIHGYDAISDETTWQIVHTKLPILRGELEDLIR